MALGGGTFLTQNKILPGAYINFISVANASATLSDRGIATIPLEMNWGPEGEVITVELGEFQKNSQKIFGYAYTADELKPMREIFKHAQTVHFFRLNSSGAKAACTSYKTVTGIVNALETVKAARLAMTTVATGAQTTATFAQTAAQYGLNAALMACPLTWIIILIIALVALFYAAVAAVNHFAGTSVSATGLICGAFMAALAFIGNIFVALWNLVVDVFVMIYNLVATVANFIGNVFNDPVGAVARLFFDLADTVLSVLQALASAIDTIFGSNLAGSVQGWRDSLGGWVDSTFGKGEEIMEKLNAEDLHLGRFEYGAAFDMGYEFGQGVEDTVGGLFDFSAMDSLGAADGLDAFNLGNTLDGIYGNTGDTAGNTAAMSDALDIAEEDLAYMRDIAEREAINRFTTAEIKVEQHNENHISKDTDLDGIMDAWANDFAEKLDVSEEGVHE